MQNQVVLIDITGNQYNTLTSLNFIIEECRIFWWIHICFVIYDTQMQRITFDV